MGIFGGSASSTSSLSNAIAFNPVINVGDDNDARTTADQTTEARATSSAKDEFGMSAGFALGPNSSAQGGEMSRTGDVQPMSATPISSTQLSKKTIYIIGGVLLVVTVGFIALKKKKK